MAYETQLDFGHVYHIYNRGVNREDIFKEKRNYEYFLKLYLHHVTPIAHTYAYCLLKNHFHLLVQIKTLEEIESEEETEQTRRVLETRRVSAAFGNCFNGYAKAINKAYNRTGSLFQRPFGRIHVDHHDYFNRLIHYIHFNPQKHGFVEDFRDYTYSSYNAILSARPTNMARKTILDIFDGREKFIEFHQTVIIEEPIQKFIGDDDE